MILICFSIWSVWNRFLEKIFLKHPLTFYIKGMIKNGNYLKLFDQFVNQKIKTSIYSKKARYIYNTYKVKYPTTIQLICKLDKSWKKYMMHFLFMNDITIYLGKKSDFIVGDIIMRKYT